MSVQEYYQELQKGMVRCGVVEDQEDQIVRFYGGLRHDIQDIIDYKEYHSIQRLFHISMLAKKGLQGRQQQRRSNTVTPRQPLVLAKPAPSSSFRAPTPSSSTGCLWRTQHRASSFTWTRPQWLHGASGCCSKEFFVQPIPGSHFGH